MFSNSINEYIQLFYYVRAIRTVISKLLAVHLNQYLYTFFLLLLFILARSWVLNNYFLFKFVFLSFFFFFFFKYYLLSSMWFLVYFFSSLKGEWWWGLIIRSWRWERERDGRGVGSEFIHSLMECTTRRRRRNEGFIRFILEFFFFKFGACHRIV